MKRSMSRQANFPVADIPVPPGSPATSASACRMPATPPPGSTVSTEVVALPALLYAVFKWKDWL
jgi:hypothetical protein